MKKLEKLTLRELENVVTIIDDQKSIVDGSTTATVLNTAAEAYRAAEASSCQSGHECAGLVLVNGTALLHEDPNATLSTCHNLEPITTCCDGQDVATFNGVQVVDCFHTHFNSLDPSGSDIDWMNTYAPNASMTIIVGNYNRTY